MADEAQRPSALTTNLNIGPAETSEDYKFSNLFAFGFIPLAIAGIIVMCATVSQSFHVSVFAP